MSQYYYDMAVKLSRCTVIKGKNMNCTVSYYDLFIMFVLTLNQRKTVYLLTMSLYNYFIEQNKPSITYYFIKQYHFNLRFLLNQMIWNVKYYVKVKLRFIFIKDSSTLQEQGRRI